MTSPGWYTDPSGEPGQRYFNGIEWTEHRQAVAASGLYSDTERVAILDNAVMLRVSQGGRVESRTPFQAVMVYGKPVNQVVHAILTVFTCFLWAIVWLMANSSKSGEHREVIQVDPYGRVTYTEGNAVVVLPAAGTA